VAGNESEQITPEEFERDWITVACALETLEQHWGGYIARRTLFQHLQHGLLTSRAEVVIVENRGKYPYAEIISSFWRKELPDYHPFWKTGIFETMGEFGGRDRKVTCFKVRFDPDGFRGMLPREAKPLSTAPDDEEATRAASINRRMLPPLPDRYLNEWHALFLKAYPAGNASQAWASVNGMFPKHRIARERIRELFKGVPVGRPRENKD
jgi:hypothetical protein